MNEIIPPQILIPAVILAILFTPILNKCERQYEQRRENRLIEQGFKRGPFGIWYKKTNTE